MPILIYATNEHGSAIFPLEAHAAMILAPDRIARAERGEPPYSSNPVHIPFSGHSLSEGNFLSLVHALGLDPRRGAEGYNFAIGEVVHGAETFIAGGAGVPGNPAPDGWWTRQAAILLAIAAAALPHGATRLVAL